MTEQKFRTGPSFWISLILIGLGTMFLFDNLGFYFFEDIFDLWPLGLIGIGVFKLFYSRFTDVKSSAVIIAIGAIFFLDDLRILDIGDIFDLWPLALILVGGRLLLGQKSRDSLADGPLSSSADLNWLDEFAIFGGKSVRVASNAFEGGNVTAVFGGVDIDLDETIPLDTSCTIEALAMFGGVEIRVPRDWDVVLKGFPIFGGFSDERRRVASADEIRDKVLIVRGYAIFGGVEVKNS